MLPSDLGYCVKALRTVIAAEVPPQPEQVSSMLPKFFVSMHRGISLRATDLRVIEDEACARVYGWRTSVGSGIDLLTSVQL